MASTDITSFRLTPLPARSFGKTSELAGASLWLWWAVASAAGGALVGVLGGTLFWLVLLVFAPVFVLPQWLLLRRQTYDAAGWPILTALASIVAFFVTVPIGGLLALSNLGGERQLNQRITEHLAPFSPMLVDLLSSPMAFQLQGLLPGLLGGQIIGGMQHIVAGDLGAPKGRWLLASGLGGAVLGQAMAFWAAFNLNGHASNVELLESLVLGIASGAVAGAAYAVPTGLVLARVPLDRHAPSSPWRQDAPDLVAAALVLALVSVLMVGASAAYTRSSSSRLAEAAAGQVPPGQPLSQATRQLTATRGYWHHRECGPDPASGATRTLFLYGERSTRTAGLVLLTSTGPAGREQVGEVAVLPDHGPLISGDLAACRQTRSSRPAFD